MYDILTAGCERMSAEVSRSRFDSSKDRGMLLARQQAGLFMRFVRFALFLLIGALIPSLCRSQEGCVTAQCHVTLLKAKVIHPATEACDTCHESTAAPHPQKGAKTFKLTQDLPELCSNCHDALGTKASVHPPVADGDCTTCHDPHASEEPKLLTQPIAELCLTCHSDKTEFAVVHGPASAGECVACHNPHESEIKPLLSKPVEELCFGCHEDMQGVTKKKDVHPPVLESCTDCHNPHGAAYKGLLAFQGKELCFQCHSDISDEVSNAKIAHPPVTGETGCTSCHSPHSSDNDRLLLKAGKELCLDCHRNIIQENMTVLHGPIKEGNCTPCHNPHGSPYASLLSKEFPTADYVPYTKAEYELCFSCHKRDLLEYPDTSFATNFRDGERNLHYLHVNKTDKGRSCTFCHNVHGSNNPKLIAENVPFGKWNLPIKFIQTETGGSCSPGCHKPQSYDRKNSR